MITEPIVLGPVGGPRHYKTVNIALCTRQELCFILTDQANKPLDLGSIEPVLPDGCDEDKCEPEDELEGADNENPGFDDGIEPKRDWPDVVVKMVAVPGYGQAQVFNVEGTVRSYKEGKVVFHLDQRHTNKPGMYLGEIGLFRGDLLMARYPMYVVMEPTAFATQQSGRWGGQITVAEIRLTLRDTMPNDNFLLDEVEFKTHEIMQAMRMPIDYWNGILPPDVTLKYNYNELPDDFRYFLLRGTTGYLLEMAAASYRRNELVTNAGGVQLADRSKWQQYDNRARELIQEFQVWAKMRKAALSMEMAGGRVHSPYIIWRY